MAAALRLAAIFAARGAAGQVAVHDERDVLASQLLRPRRLPGARARDGDRCEPARAGGDHVRWALDEHDVLLGDPHGMRDQPEARAREGEHLRLTRPERVVAAARLGERRVRFGSGS